VNASEVTEFGLALRKALNAYRFYPPGHAKVIEFNEKVLGSLRVLGGVALNVTVAGLLVGEQVVLEGESVTETPTRPLFLEGILRINVSQEVGLDELSELLRVWHAALIRQVPEGQTLTTMFWELGLRRIGFDFSELAGMQDTTDAEIAREERRKTLIASLLQGFSAKSSAKRSPPSSASAMRTTLETTTGLDFAQSKTDFILPSPLTAAELAQVGSDVRSEKAPLAARVSMAAWEVFEASLDAERPLVAKWFERSVLQLIDAPVNVLVEVVQRLGSSARQTGASERLVGWLTVLIQPTWFTRWVALLDDAATSKSVEELFSQLPRSLVAELVPLLPKLKSPETRLRLVSQWSARKVPIRALGSAKVQVSDVEWVKVMIEHATDGKSTLAELYQGAPSAMRVALLEQLPEALFTTMKAAVVTSIDSSDARERLAAAKLAGTLKLTEAEAPVARALMAMKGKPEALAWMSMLAGFETVQALEALVAYFQVEKDLSLRVSVVRLIGQVGSPRMLGFLERASSGFLSHRRLKDACAEAIRSIRSGVA